MILGDERVGTQIRATKTSWYPFDRNRRPLGPRQTALIRILNPVRQLPLASMQAIRCQHGDYVMAVQFRLWMQAYQIDTCHRLRYSLHIRMGTSEPNFFNITDSFSRISPATVGIHLYKVFRHELDSTFIKSERMSEMARVYCRCGFGDMHISLDETQRRHRIPTQR